MGAGTQAPEKKIRKTSYRLPEALLDAVSQVVERGGAESQTAFVERALRHELASIRRKELSEAYAAAAQDQDFLEEMGAVEQEFDGAVSDGLD